MRKGYDELGNYELNLLEMRWEEEHPDEPAPKDATGWKTYYDGLPDDAPIFRVDSFGLELYADDEGPIRRVRCTRCDTVVVWTEIFNDNNQYIGDGYFCPNCARVRITRLP